MGKSDIFLPGKGTSHLWIKVKGLGSERRQRPKAGPQGGPVQLDSPQAKLHQVGATEQSPIQGPCSKLWGKFNLLVDSYTQEHFAVFENSYRNLFYYINNYYLTSSDWKICPWSLYFICCLLSLKGPT